MPDSALTAVQRSRRCEVHRCGLLVDFVERQLPPEVHRELEATSRKCPRCVTQLKTYESTVSLLRTINEDDLPPELRWTLKSFVDRAAAIDRSVFSACEAAVRVRDRDGAGRAAERREPARVHPRRHGDAPDRHRRRHRLPPAHAQPAGHRRRRRPAVPPPDQGRRPDHPAGPRHRGLEHVARSRRSKCSRRRS